MASLNILLPLVLPHPTFWSSAVQDVQIHLSISEAFASHTIASRDTLIRHTHLLYFTGNALWLYP